MKKITITTATADKKRSASVQHNEAENFEDLQKIGENIVVYHFNNSVRQALTGSLKNHLVSVDKDGKFVYTPEQVSQLPKLAKYTPSIPAQRQTTVDKTENALSGMNPSDLARVQEYLNKKLAEAKA